MIKKQPISRYAAAIVLLAIIALPTTATADIEKAEKIAKHAIAAGLRGDGDKRQKLLAAALETNPNSRLANWATGKVQVDGDWLTVGEVEKRMQHDATQKAYDIKRAELRQGKLTDWQLAAWCRSQALPDTEKLHLTKVLQSDEATLLQKSQAVSRLGLKNVRGIWLTPQEVQQLQDSIASAKRNDQRWAKVVSDLRTILEGKQNRKKQFAIDQFRQAVDSTAINTMERLLSTRSESLAGFAVQIISELPEFEASESLVRHSVFSPWNSIRRAATNRLQSRELNDTVPLLLAELFTPLQSQYRVAVGADGMIRRTQHVYREGRNAKQVLTDTSARGPHAINVVQNVVRAGRVIAQVHPDDVFLGNVLARRRGVDNDDPIRMSQLASEIRQQLALARRNIVHQEVQKAQGLTQHLAVVNLLAGEKNKRAIFALSEITAAKVEPATPTAWWDWWNDENERYQQEKPTVTRYTSYSDPYQVQYVRPAHECFPAGTLVRTQLGKMAIETIIVGDRVLSQDIDTGELTYKIVVTTTERPPSHVVRILLNDHSIESTTGHLFWVYNHGWKMAKNLQSGDELHALGRGVKVDQVEEQGEAIAYNLVVADFGTYFVGDQDILAHDNTERKPTKAIAPGVTVN